MNSKALSSFALVLALLGLVSGCSEPSEPQAAPSASVDQPVPTPIPVEPQAPLATQAISDDVPLRFRAIGTEPFWSVQVQDGKLTYSTPDMPDGLTVPATLRRSGQIVTYSATIDGKPLELEVSRQTCSDGMSDLKHPFTAEFVLGKDTFKGCARDPSVPVEAP